MDPLSFVAGSIFGALVAWAMVFRTLAKLRRAGMRRDN